MTRKIMLIVALITLSFLVACANETPLTQTPPTDTTQSDEDSGAETNEPSTEDNGIEEETPTNGTEEEAQTDEDVVQEEEDAVVEEDEDDGMIYLTLAQLAEFNGQDGNPAYIAVSGVIYDVSASSRWRGGIHNGDPSISAGNDLTLLINSSPHGRRVLDNIPKIGYLVTS